MNDAFSFGYLLGAVGIWGVGALAAMIWVAEYLDRYFRDWFEDYVLALMSYLPLASFLLLISGLRFAGARGDVGVLRAKVELGALLLAVLIGFAIRIFGMDEEVEGNDSAKGDKPR